ncbi:MAG: hypothetical protein DVS81_02725 [Candidatus Accumulibacter meliphilus]|jgi:hypothetical protein|uniref:Uncharacterized protein n=1 Tax=Candidatus Accumulibacter meliphilus TaxID=2211374 RepID=A0A369XTS7_9PROT|nr:MAG: hypothetical protein DVS81_02725 [Candidatus Accumulibacter meliphilus]
MPNPYFRKAPGDVLRASEWNELQVKAREEILGHRHTGNEDGSLIPRAAIEAGAIDGKLIDPAAEVSVKTLTTSGNLVVKGELAVNGKALLGDIADLLATVKGLQAEKLNRAGDTVINNLLVGGAFGIGTPTPTHRFHVVALNEVGLFESSGVTACLRLSTREGLEHRVEITNRPGGRLSLWNNGEDVFNITRDRNVGIGTITPGQKLMVQGNHNAGKDPDSGLVHGGQVAIKGNSPQLDFIDTDDNDWAIFVQGSKMHFVRQPWNYTDLVLGANGYVGMGTDNPKAKLSVVGTAMISDGTGYAVPQERMVSGSLTIGSTATSYGGGSGWNANTAGLMLETMANTEIAVHDGGSRVASLMYYEGDSANRITIGRDMGWGVSTMASAGPLIAEGNRVYPKIKAFRDQIVTNGGVDVVGQWKVNYAGEFVAVYECLVVLQGFSDLATGFTVGTHVASDAAIPQTVYIKLSGFDEKMAWGIAYCSESRKENEVDNRVMFTLVVFGA